MPAKTCQECKEPYPGFGPTCGRCRKGAGAARNGYRACERCGQYFGGSGPSCADCAGKELDSLVGSAASPQAVGAPPPSPPRPAPPPAQPRPRGAGAAIAFRAAHEVSASARTAEGLREGLAMTRQGGTHWCCDESFLDVCGLVHKDLEIHVQRWWGNVPLWLDMLATELAKVVGDEVGLGDQLEEGWSQAADAWVESTYVVATESRPSPPARALLFARALGLKKRVLAGVALSPPRSRFSIKKAATALCEVCQLPFSQRLGRCPSCFPPEARSSLREGTEVDAQATEQEWRSLPSAPLDSVDWAAATAVRFCHGGSGGVFLVRLPSGVVCVKSCSPSELFAQRLSAALGVKTASVRVLDPSGDEWTKLKSSVRSLSSQTGENSWAQIRSILNVNFASILEYVDGVGMMGVRANRYLAQEGGDDNADLWCGLGRLMAFDMLINNFDRLPLAWTNEGNLGNVMLGCKQGLVVGIDQSVSPITHQEGFQKYAARVRRALAEARDGEGKYFEWVKEAVYNNTAVALEPAAVEAMRRGCLDFSREVAALSASGALEASLAAVGEEVRETFGELFGCHDAVRAAQTLVAQVAASMREELG